MDYSNNEEDFLAGRWPQMNHVEWPGKWEDHCESIVLVLNWICSVGVLQFLDDLVLWFEVDDLSFILNHNYKWGKNWAQFVKLNGELINMILLLIIKDKTS
jgi:hypothetical protein